KSCGSLPSAGGDGLASGRSWSRASSAAKSAEASGKRLSAPLASIRESSASTASGASGHAWLEPRRFLEEDLGEHRHQVLGLEGRLARDALEQHAPQREDVG